jgi:DNA (cytosine-5)-methyltransferase 1
MTAYYNDIDPHCCRVLRKQVAAGNLPPGDVDERDIRDVRAEDLAGYDAIHLFAGVGGFPLGLRMAGVPDDFGICTGGFPCQDISNAGRKAGIDGDRSGLWSEFARILRDLRPRHVLVENVAALLVRGMGRVLGDLAALGYDAEWAVLPASAVGALHIRPRVFIVAYPGGVRPQPRGEALDLAGAGRDAEGEAREWQRGGHAALDRRAVVADPERPGLALGSCFGGDAREELAALERGHRTGRGIWAVEPDVGRMVDGIPARVDRLRSLGNAIVPQVVEFIGRRLMGGLPA